VSLPTFSCSGMTCTFDGSGSTDDSGIVAYEWRSNGNLLKTVPVFTIDFKTARTRTWTLTVRDAQGLEDTASITFTVPAP